jgi:hypothetical protein
MPTTYELKTKPVKTTLHSHNGSDIWAKNETGGGKTAPTVFIKKKKLSPDL